MNAYVSYSWTCCTKVICILVTQGLVSRGTISNTRFSGKKYIFFHPFLLGGYLGLLLFPFNLWNRLKPASVYYGQRFLKRIDISVQQFMYNWTPTICTFCPTHKKSYKHAVKHFLCLSQAQTMIWTFFALPKMFTIHFATNPFLNKQKRFFLLFKKMLLSLYYY